MLFKNKRIEFVFVHFYRYAIVSCLKPIGLAGVICINIHNDNHPSNEFVLIVGTHLLA